MFTNPQAALFLLTKRYMIGTRGTTVDFRYSNSLGCVGIRFLIMASVCTGILRDHHFNKVHVARSIENLAIKGNLAEVDESANVVGGFMVMLTVVYGGINAAAWNAQFPSNTEQMMWRIASCWVMGGGLLIAVFGALGQLCDHGAMQGYAGLVFGLICLMLFGIYAAARSFLIIEAFISVRSLPAEAYNTVDWINAVPHIG